MLPKRLGVSDTEHFALGQIPVLILIVDAEPFNFLHEDAVQVDTISDQQKGVTTNRTCYLRGTSESDVHSHDNFPI